MRNTKVMMDVFTSVLFSLLVHGSASEFNLTAQKAQGNRQMRFSLGGNLASGLYYAILPVGRLTVKYHLHLDSGSSLTWIQCAGADAKQAPNPPYMPHINKYIPKSDPDCPPSSSTYNGGNHYCDYRLTYMDGGSSSGHVVRDDVHLEEVRNDGTVSRIRSLVFGCGQYVPPNNNMAEPMIFDGILGLGKERSSFPSQLNALDLTRSFFGHCLSSRPEGTGRSGYGFFGDRGASRSSNTIWLPMHHSPSHYVVGPARLSFDGIPEYHIDVSTILIDSGSTYTAFQSHIYQFIDLLVKMSLDQAPLSLINHGHQHLPVCWKGNIDEVRPYFKAIKLEFIGHGIIEFKPEEYLIITASGDVCLGIVDSHAHTNTNVNILGAISMLDKVVMYDNERNRIGWGPRDPTNCIRDRLHSTETVLEIAVLESLSVNATLHHGAAHH